MPKKFRSRITNARRVRLGYITAFLLLIFSLGLTNFITKKLLVQTEDVAKTNAIINILEQVLGSVKDAETGVRGYFIMKDKIYLEPYNNSRRKADSLNALLMQQTTGNAYQQQQLQTLQHLVGRRFTIINHALDTFIKYKYKTEIFVEKKQMTGKAMMDSLRKQIKSMQDYEKNELLHRQQKVDHIASLINYINIASLIVSILLAIYAIATFSKENAARKEAGKKADEYRKRLEERVIELRSANVELMALRNNEKFVSTGRIARTIAHEVRNPLTNINLAIEQLQDEIGDKDATRPLMQMVERNSLRIQQLITDLLNSTKFAELHFNNTSINNLIDETLTMAQDRLVLNRIAVVKKYSPDLPDLHADIEKLKIGILNIVMNAIEAMHPENGVLTVATFEQNNTCSITIADNGKGMSNETLQKLFDPYFTKKPKGHGLGLTNTQNIVLNHKGHIHVESEEDKGTTFTITLPFTNQAAKPSVVQ